MCLRDVDREPDVGLLDPLYNAVSWVLLQFHSFWSLFFGPASGAAWGLSIVLLVVLIRICLIPLFVRQIKAQRGLQLLQPQMKEIQTRYKNDKAKQQEELMKLYRETGTNPLSSCLPLLVQSPFFFALYHVLSYIAQGKSVGVITDPLTIASAHHATIFGAPIYETFRTGDSRTKVVAAIMIILMSATTFITQRQLMAKNQPLGQSNPMLQQQKILLYVFPLMFALFGINFPIGVLIYWLTTNLWTMGQQLIVIRRNPTPGSEAALALERRKAEKAAAKAAAQAIAAGAPPVEEPSPDPKGQRSQPRRSSRAQRSRGTPGQQPKSEATAADASTDLPGEAK